MIIEIDAEETEAIISALKDNYLHLPMFVVDLINYLQERLDENK